jgi:hypothetical protein
MDNKKQFLKKLRGLSQRRSSHRVFSDWLETAAISMHQLPYHSGELPRDDDFERLEQLYLERIKPYSKDELMAFSEMLAIVISALGNGMGYSDFLGEIAGEAELLNKGSGQFFTPYHLCQAITRMTLGDVDKVIKEKGIIAVCEPASGSGSMVIASAEEVDMQGIDPRVHMQFDCTDISRDAFNMTYIQLSALGLQAMVRHGNTLSNEYWEHRPTPQLRLFQRWLETQQRTARMVAAMRSLLGGEAIAEPALPSTMLFDVDEFAVDSQQPKRDSLGRLRPRPQPDIVLDSQISLFG